MYAFEEPGKHFAGTDFVKALDPQSEKVANHLLPADWLQDLPHEKRANLRWVRVRLSVHV
jgi:hypothetical protein